ncbi:unnamed protein product [Cuscuta campestris]|uniref:ATP phosphoribosyltransferase n=1 Tax=Cuscuta campestris TaxID=132261 RepID=A0A484L2X8_9ASTE|nr:unnamed protein product [Cuscuta campestris]
MKKEDTVELISAEGFEFVIDKEAAMMGPKFMNEKGLNHVTFSTPDGALKATPAMGIVDAIVDLVSSGTTLGENNLKEIAGGVILQIQMGIVDAIVDLVSSGTTLGENNLKEIAGGVILQIQLLQPGGLSKGQKHILRAEQEEGVIGLVKTQTEFAVRSRGGVWRTVETGWTEPVKHSDDLSTTTVKKFEDYSRAEVLAAENNDKALNAIFGAVDATQYRLISNCISAKEAWDILEVTHEGDEKVKTAKYQILMTQYENLRMDEKETIVEFHGRVRDLANQAARLQEPFPESKLVLKVLRSLPERFDMDVKAISQSHDAKKMTLDALMGNLETIELNMKEDSKRRKPEKQIAFLGTDLENDSEDGLAFDEEFQEHLSLFTKQFKKKWIQKKGKSQIQEGPSKTSTFRESRFKEGKPYDNSSKYKGPLCFECGGHGHIQTECANNLKKKRQAFSITWSDDDSDEDQGGEESNCAFISQSESDDLVKQHMDLQEKWTELLMVNRRNIVEKNQLACDLKVLKQNLEKAEANNADLKFELQKLKDYIKWMKIAGAEVLDSQEMMFKAPGDRQGIGCDSHTKTDDPLKEDSVKITKNMRNSDHSAVKPIKSYNTKRHRRNSLTYQNYRCYYCRRWGHIKRACQRLKNKRTRTQKIKQIWVPKERVMTHMVRTKIALPQRWTGKSPPKSPPKKKIFKKPSWTKLFTMPSKSSSTHTPNNEEREHDELPTEEDVLKNPILQSTEVPLLKYIPSSLPDNESSQNPSQESKRGMSMEDEESLKGVSEPEFVGEILEEEPIIACSNVPFQDPDSTCKGRKERKKNLSGPSRWSLRKMKDSPAPDDKSEEERKEQKNVSTTKAKKAKLSGEAQTSGTRKTRSSSTSKVAESATLSGKSSLHNFISISARSHFTDIAKKFIIPQRNLDISDFKKKTNLLPVLESNNLFKSVTLPGSYVKKVIQEFFCNLSDACMTNDDPSFHKVFVRGKFFDFSPTVINTLLGTTSCSVVSPIDEDTIWHDLTNGVRNSQHGKLKVPSSVLKSSYALLLKIASYHWLPTTHTNTVPLCMATLIYRIKHCIPFDLGKLVFDQVMTFAATKFKTNQNGLPYPLLIYNILNSQGFTKEDCEEEEQVPPLLQADNRHFEGKHFNDMVTAGASPAAIPNPASVDN